MVSSEQNKKKKGENQTLQKIWELSGKLVDASSFAGEGLEPISAPVARPRGGINTKEEAGNRNKERFQREECEYGKGKREYIFYKGRARRQNERRGRKTPI